jgi:hypothetical protein
VGGSRAEQRLRVGGALALGAFVCAAVLGFYNKAAFGSPFSVSYASEAGNFAELRRGLFGITYPRPEVILELLVGQYRGLLPLSPLMALAPIGFWVWYRRGDDRRMLVPPLFIAAYYLLLNASYAYWEGGWSYGPRQMAPALPFLSLTLAPLWRAANRSGRAALSALAICGVCITLVAVSTTAQPPSVYKRPLSELWWPAFRDGDLSLNHTSFTMAGWDPQKVRGHPEVHEAWNLGELLGLKAHDSLLPLFAVWFAATLWWVEAERYDSSAIKSARAARTAR